MNKKIKKIISESLIAAILFFNISTYSLATTLSDDTRYEVFEGDNISIHNILEDNKIDVEIEGNTLVNIHPKYTPYLDISNNNDGYTVESRENYIKVVGDNSTLDWLYVHFGNLNINMFKPNTTYTIVFSKLKGIDYIALQTSASTSQIANHVDVVNGQLVYTFNTNNQITDEGQVLYLGVQNTSVDLEVENPMIIEGDWSINPPKGYFEGMKSVGQDNENGHKINFFSNKYAWLEGLKIKGVIGGDIDLNEKDDTRISMTSLQCKPNTIYEIIDNNNYYTWIAFSDDTNKILSFLKWERRTHFTTPSYATKVRIQFAKSEAMGEIKINIDDVKDISIVGLGNEITTKEILLNEPLRGLPNGVKDRFVKIGNKWFIERNCGVIKPSADWNWIKGSFPASFYSLSKIYGGSSYAINTVCDNFPGIEGNPPSNKYYGVATCNAAGGAIAININPEWLPSISVNNFKEWLESNPLTVIYQLATPIYEPLEIAPTINTYLDTTHIFNDSTIPTSMKVTVDRVANRAQEAIKLAKLNPTVQNISIARMWINLMQDSVLKDQFNEDTNNIIEIEDMEIEKKKASANLDLYIKTKNTLSLSLDTNSVTFDNYSGVEDVELLNAVNLTVNSSLPYSLNAYMEEGFYNSDKTNSLEVNSLNIRENTDTTYKQFTNIKEKLILKDNCDEGNAKYHTIDLKLNGNNAHKIDVYKTVIKFEIEQK